MHEAMGLAAIATMSKIDSKSVIEGWLCLIAIPIRGSRKQ